MCYWIAFKLHKTILHHICYSIPTIFSENCKKKKFTIYSLFNGWVTFYFFIIIFLFIHYFFFLHHHLLIYGQHYGGSTYPRHHLLKVDFWKKNKANITKDVNRKICVWHVQSQIRWTSNWLYMGTKISWI